MISALRSSVRNQLVLLFFAITAGAVGFVYLYVVPQLSSSLTAERLERLERDGFDQMQRLVEVGEGGVGDARLRALLQRISSAVEARVTLLGVREMQPRFVVADSESDAEAALGDYRPAQGAVSSGAIRSGTTTRGGVLLGMTAVPLAPAGDLSWVAVLSTTLEGVESNVELIRRQILIAGAIALAASLLAAWLAAAAHARRLRRLEQAAEQVSQGNFNVPIPDEGPDEVGQLAKAFDEMQRRLARLEEARREFIANASHELRTPVASLGGFIELLDDEEPDPETRRQFVTVMRQQVNRLTKLTADLLDLSKLDADALTLSDDPVDLVTVASEAARELAALAERRGSTVEIAGAEGGKPLARGDHGRVLQILRILVDNAIKHTPEGTKITISTETRSDVTSVSVVDDGPGIEPPARERVFERFFTADSVSGSGLGLAIARELARLMDGDLELDSHRGRTAFTLSLPTATGVRA